MRPDNLLRLEALPDPQPAAEPRHAPWLSILIPVYNVAPWLGQCLASILPQVAAAGDVEILLVDDASSDCSRQICERICEQYGPLVRMLVHERNRGLSAARNTLLAAASGRYVWFVDSDDEMLPGAIATLREVIDRHQPDIVLCDYRKQGRTVTGFAGPAHVLGTDREALVLGVFAGGRMHTWSKVARRALWGEDLRFPVGRCFEDIMTTPWLCLRARSFYYVAEPWIAYRVRAGSIMAAATRRGSFDERMNDDLAGALAGFRTEAAARLPQMSALTGYHVGGFCARKFTQIGWRLLRTCLLRSSWQSVRTRLQRYRALTEDCSTQPFEQLAAEHLRRGRLRRWLELKLLLQLTQEPAAAETLRLSGVAERVR